MIRRFGYDNGEVEVAIEITPAKRDAIVEMVLRFYADTRAWSGESVMQNDKPQIEAAPFLANLVDDIICPEVTYK